MQLQQKIVPDCSTLNLPDNYEQFVEGIDNPRVIHEPEHGQKSGSSGTSPRVRPKRQLKVSCSIDQNDALHFKVINTYLMILSSLISIIILLCMPELILILKHFHRKIKKMSTRLIWGTR